MIAASFVGIFVIPPLYVVFQGLRERAWRLLSGGTSKKTDPAARPEAPAGTPGISGGIAEGCPMNGTDQACLDKERAMTSQPASAAGSSGRPTSASCGSSKCSSATFRPG